MAASLPRPGRRGPGAAGVDARSVSLDVAIKAVANYIDANDVDGGREGVRKAGGNWVDDDRFFDREAEVEALSERIRDGAHTLLTAQRRMGKTSLEHDGYFVRSHDGYRFASRLIEDWWRARYGRNFTRFADRTPQTER